MTTAVGPRYQYSRSPAQPFAVDFPPLPQREKDALFRDGASAFAALFPVVEAAVQSSGDGESGTTNKGKSTFMWTSCAVFGTIDEVAELHMSERVPLIPSFEHSKRLYALHVPTKDAPFRCSALRWSLWKAATALADARDLCYVEHMDAFVDTATGRRSWARAAKSVRHPSCPASQHPNGPVRTVTPLFGMIFRETDRFGVLEHIMYVEIDARSATGWVANQGFAAVKKTTNDLNHMLKVLRLAKLQYPHKFGRNTTPPSFRELRDDDTERSNSSNSSSSSAVPRECRSCQERISKWTPAKRCRYCDAMLCKRCVELHYQTRDVRSKNHRLCLHCAVSGEADKPEHNERGRARSRGQTVDSKARDKQSSFGSGKGSGGSVCSNDRPLSFSTDSVGSGSKDEATVGQATDAFERLGVGSHSPSGSSSGASNSSGRHPVPVRSDSASSSFLSQSRRRQASLAVALELEAPRPAPVDLSYLTTLVTPRGERKPLGNDDECRARDDTI